MVVAPLGLHCWISTADGWKGLGRSLRGIGDRLAARLSAEGRRLMETRRMDTQGGDQDEGDQSQNGRGGRSRIQSPEVKYIFQQYNAWHKLKARTDLEAAVAAIEKEEHLLAEYHRHQEHLKVVLTEDSFTCWLKNLQADENGENLLPPPPPGQISHRYGKWAQVLREQPKLAQ